ncbi:phosphotransferase family protein [Vagococcus sp.]|uniref:phosphotransferase family protein n=1 Tax=Vagococcus sp. TaxID=1933889 RepID=UPI003F96B273
MIFKFDKNWNLQPLKGDTGKAYKGVKDQEKVFLKRNSTPFLAALSREGLTPKLLWTRRTGNGDIVTAQEWLDCRQLSADEMVNNQDVIRILYHLHHSESLKSMLERMEGSEKSAFDFLSEYVRHLPQELKENPTLLKVFKYLEDHLPAYLSQHYVACHGDVIRQNWLISNDDHLFLVDWDYSVLCDPALDLGTILGQYVPLDQWSVWLDHYKAEMAEHLHERVYWYAGMSLLMQTKRSFLKEEHNEVARCINRLNYVYQDR